MSSKVQIKRMASEVAATLVDAFYEQEGKNHRANPGDLFFVAYLDNKVVGVCRFCIEENTPLLRSMIVQADLRAQKIGAKILESFESYLTENNIGPTYCIPYDHLEKFYSLIGFKIIREEESPVFLQERIGKYRASNVERFMMMKRD
jgi:hypothetical protein